jgi:recombination DNA repair RAD52 pathway protein
MHMPEAKLNWSTAKVDDRQLSVDLEGEVSKEWKRSFKTTLRLLGSGDWGEVTLKKHSVRVGEVEPGSEEKLRHYLESVVAQANASQAPDEADDEHTEDEAGEDADEARDRDDPDAKMTEQFRSFANAD